MRLPVSTSEHLKAPTKATRTADIVRRAINEGKPLPLTVMLENMSRFRDEAVRLEGLKPGDEDWSERVADLAKSCRLAAQKCAVDAAPFVHPKLATVTVGAETEEEAAERRAVQRATSDELRGRSVQDLGRMYMQLVRGEEVDGLCESTPAVRGEEVEDTPSSDADASVTEEPSGSITNSRASGSQPP